MSRNGFESVIAFSKDEISIDNTSNNIRELINLDIGLDGESGAVAAVSQRLDLDSRDTADSSDDSDLAATADMGDGHLLIQNPELLDDSEEHAVYLHSTSIELDTTVTVTVTMTEPFPVSTLHYHAGIRGLAPPPLRLPCDCERMPAACCYCC